MTAGEPLRGQKSVAFAPPKLHSSSLLGGLFPPGNAAAVPPRYIPAFGGGCGCVAGLRSHAGGLGARSCARLARLRHLKYWIRDVFRAEMSNPASSTVYLLQSTTLLYARACTHARRAISETPTPPADSLVLLRRAKVAGCSRCSMQHMQACRCC